MKKKYSEDYIQALKKTAAAEYRNRRKHAKFSLLSDNVATILAKMHFYGIDLDLADFIIEAEEIKQQNKLSDELMRVTMAIKRFSIDE